MGQNQLCCNSSIVTCKFDWSSFPCHVLADNLIIIIKSGYFVTFRCLYLFISLMTLMMMKTHDADTFKVLKNGTVKPERDIILYVRITLISCATYQYCVPLSDILFCSLVVLDPRVSHTMDVLSPFITVLCHSDWLFHVESCPRLLSLSDITNFIFIFYMHSEHKVHYIMLLHL